MKKLTLFLATLLCSLSIFATKTFYLKPGTWNLGNERYAIYAYGSDNAWYSMTAVSGETDLYSADVDDSKFTSIIYVRLDASKTENNWDNKWNQTADLSIASAGGNCYEMTDWSTGKWSTYTPSTPSTPETNTVFGNENQFFFIIKDVKFGELSWREDKDYASDMITAYGINSTTNPYTRTFTNFTGLKAGTYQYQVAGRVSATNAYAYYPTKTSYLTFNATGEINSIAVSFDPANPDKTSVTLTYKEGTEETPELYLIGELSSKGWVTNAGDKFAYNESTKLFTLPVKPTKDTYFSVVSKLVDGAANWDGILPYRYGAASDGTKLTANTAAAITKGNGNSFIAPAGDYTLTVDLNKLTVTLVGEQQDEPDDPVELDEYTVKLYNPGWDKVMAYIWNSPKYDSKDWDKAVELTKDENGWYAATIQEGGNIIFRSATVQTVNIENIKADVCYELGDQVDGLYTVKVNATCTVTPQADNYQYLKVEGELKDWTGEYLIVYEAGKLAFDGSKNSSADLKGSSTNVNSFAVSIDNNAIVASDEVDAKQFTIAAIEGKTTYSLMSATGFYIGSTSDANALNANKSAVYENSIMYDADNSCISIASSSAVLRYNKAASGLVFRYYKSSTYKNQQPIQLYKRIKVGEKLEYAGATVVTKDYYLDATQFGYADADFYVWYWGGSNEGAFTEKLQLKEGETSVYVMPVAEDATNIIVVRANPAAIAEGKTPWEAEWNRAEALLPTAEGQDTYYITGWGEEKCDESNVCHQVAVGQWSKPEDPKAGDLYIIGKINEQDWMYNVGTKMEYDEETELYTLSDVEVKGTFSFATTLESKDWDELNTHRYGPETDAYEIESGVPAKLVQIKDNAFAPALGIYDFTVSLKDLTLTIKKTKEIEITSNYYLAGSKELTGYFWADNDEYKKNELVVKDGVASLTLENVSLIKGSQYAFKVVEVTSANQITWYGDKEGADINIAVDKTGIYNVEFTFTIATSTPAYKLTLVKEEDIESNYYVAGAEALLGVAWKADVADNKMTVADGKATLVKENVTLAAGNYEYKVVKNGDWRSTTAPTESNPDGNMILTIAEAGIYTITFTYIDDPETITAEAKKTGTIELDEYTVKLYNPGWEQVMAYIWDSPSYASWSWDDAAVLTADAEGWYAATVEEGGNIIFRSATEQTVNIENIKADVCYKLGEKDVDGKFTVELVADCKVEKPEVHYYVLGVAELFGEAWNIEEPKEMIADAEGVYTYTATELQLAAKTPYEFKVVGQKAWGGAEYPASGNSSLTVEADGVYTVVFTFKQGDAEGKAVATKTGDWTAPETVYTIVGVEELTGANWKEDYAANDMTKEAEGKYTLTIEGVTLYVGTNYEYKVVGDHSWSNEYPGANQNQTLTVDKNGIYDVLFTYDGAEQLTATATLKEEIEVKSGFALLVNDTEVALTAYTDEYGDGWKVEEIDLAVGDKLFMLNLATDEKFGFSYTDYDKFTIAEGVITVGEEGNYNLYFKQQYKSENEWDNVLYVVKNGTDDPDQHIYVVAGVVVNGAEWKPAAEENRMTLNEETGLYELTIKEVLLEAGTEYAYKVTTDGEYPEGDNLTFTVDKDAYYDVTYTYDAAKEEAKVNTVFVKESDVFITHTYTVAGTAPIANGAEWDVTFAANDMTLVNGLYTLVVTGCELYVEGEYEFKVAQDHAWTVAYPTSNYVIEVAENGVYTITYTFNAETKEVKATLQKTQDIDTALDNIQSALDFNAPMYNVMGQRVNENYRGIVIQNGQKYLLK